MTIEVGDIIDVYSVAEPVYSHYTRPIYRYIISRPFDLPRRAWYVGYTRRFYGTYEPGGPESVSMFTDEPPDYEPPRLNPEGSRLVYRVRFHERGVEHCCFPEDIVLIKKKHEE